MRTAVLFDNFGPYHIARLNAASAVGRVLGIQVCSHSSEYAWVPERAAEGFESVTLFTEGSREGVPRSKLQQRLAKALRGFHPDRVFIPGWSSVAAFTALQVCLDWAIPVVAMSESGARDRVRVPWKEWSKRRLLRLCAAAFVGGRAHADYAAGLGVPPERIFAGYDAVDNEYFSRSADAVRGRAAEFSARHGLPRRFFLASARFIKKKNLFRLLRAYARFRQEPTVGPNSRGTEPCSDWHLVLLGEGPLRKALEAELGSLGLSHCVHLPGFQQYAALPAYYGLASAFIHASTSEPWGLVVNEAMASGVPVLVSERCGCAEDLVREGVNGFTFDPVDIRQMAARMVRIAQLDEPTRKMLGASSREIIGNWGLARFAEGFQAAGVAASQTGPRRASAFERLLLRGLTYDRASRLRLCCGAGERGLVGRHRLV